MKGSLMIFIFAVFSYAGWSQASSSRITFISGGHTSSQTSITMGEPILGGNSQITLGSQHWTEPVTVGQRAFLPTSDATIFPNPFADRLNVSVKGVSENNFSVSIANLLGQEVFFQNKLSKTHSFDLGNYRQGIYFISVFNSKGEKIITKQLIKI